MKVSHMGGLVAPAMAMIAVLGGCSKAVDNGSNAHEAAAPVAEAIQDPDAVGAADQNRSGPVTDEWVGRWTGPEGLFLDIQPSPNGKPGHYAIQNRDNLDREAGYDGVAEGEAIRFSRDGRELTVRRGTGDETGFKYLAGKQECLIVIAGQEGYCR